MTICDFENWETIEFCCTFHTFTDLELNVHSIQSQFDKIFKQLDQYSKHRCPRVIAGTKTAEIVQKSIVRCLSLFSATDAQKAKEREERVRLVRERREQAELKRLEELRESIARHQEIRRKQEEERRRRMEQMKRREEEHRNMVEERQKRLLDEENVGTFNCNSLKDNTVLISQFTNIFMRYMHINEP